LEIDVTFQENIFPFLVTPPSPPQFPNTVVVAYDDIADDLDYHVSTPATEPASIQPSPAIRKSRTVKPPSWLQSFVHAPLPSHNVSSSSCQYLLSAYMSYANIVVPHYQFICAYSSIKESTTYVEAA